MVPTVGADLAGAGLDRPAGILRAVHHRVEQYSGVAQLAEQRTVNPFVVGSSPTPGAEISLMYQGFPCEAEDLPHRPGRAQDAIWSRKMRRGGP